MVSPVHAEIGKRIGHEVISKGEKRLLNFIRPLFKICKSLHFFVNFMKINCFPTDCFEKISRLLVMR